MTDHWDGWSEDQPDFDGPDGAEFGDPTPDHPDGDGYPVEGFGTADTDLSGSPDDQAGPIGYDGFGAEPPRVDPYTEADPYAEGGSGIGPDGSTELPAEVGFGSADPPIGADPDVDPYGDAAQWSETAWPEPANLDLGPPPEPVDGFPWTDPGLLGDAYAAAPVEPTTPAAAPGPDELADYAGEELPADGDPWAALAGSEDPATSALARFWSPDDR